MKAPAFWQHDGLAARVLAPLGVVTRMATARRVAQPGWHAGVPVLCIGNASVGGSGKTPVCLDIAARLVARGQAVHILTRGFGRAARDVRRADAAVDSVQQVGDEALLLARAAPTWVGADRGAAARCAIASGATVLLMDDGLQNPGLAKTASLLVVDGGAGFGNGKLLPAGPLREPVAAASARCRAAIVIGADETGAGAALRGLPVLPARMVADEAALRQVADRPVFAFAGIGRPAKFFAMLRGAGLVLAGTRAFADHHVFSAAELRAVARDAAAAGAVAVCTPKDWVRIPADWRPGVIPFDLRLVWDQPADIEALLTEVTA